MFGIRNTMIISMLALVLVSVNAQARKFDWRDVEIQVVSDESGTKTEYPVSWKRNNQRSYIAVRDGERYSIRVTNNTGERIGVVLAVDGRNIINGKKSWLRHDEPMYVLGPWQTGIYDGWRTSRKRVNRFYFTDVDDSYADNWGDHSAMGVIAAAVYREKKHHDDQYYSQEYGAARKSSKYGRGAESAGTGFGETEWSPAHKVHFKARKKPTTKKFIKYEWRRTLCRKGIIEHCGYRDHEPDNRFWPDDDDEFAPYPWQTWRRH